MDSVNVFLVLRKREVVSFDGCDLSLFIYRRGCNSKCRFYHQSVGIVL